MLLSVLYFFSKQGMYILLLHEAGLQELRCLHNSVAALLMLACMSANTQSLQIDICLHRKVQVVNELIQLLFLVS